MICGESPIYCPCDCFDNFVICQCENTPEHDSARVATILYATGCSISPDMLDAPAPVNRAAHSVHLQGGQPRRPA